MALLLLALALLGAAVALVEAMSAQHAALLQTRAVDLAGDLAETLRPGLTPDEATQQILAWQQQALLALPGAAVQALPSSGTTLDVQMNWIEPRSGRTARLHLPIASMTTPAP